MTVWNLLAACRLFGKLQNLVKFVCYLLFCWITIFGVSFIRYEFNKLSLDNRISNLIKLSQGNELNFALETVSVLQGTPIPVEPKLTEPMSLFKTFFERYDYAQPHLYEDLHLLLLSQKKSFKDLRLEGLILTPPNIYLKEKGDFEG